MAKVTTIVLIVVIIIFIIIDIAISLLAFSEYRKYNTCATNQSTFCPTVTCNTADSSQQTTAGQSCFPYGYRYTNEDQTQWVCNFPLAGLTPITTN